MKQVGISLKSLLLFAFALVVAIPAFSQSSSEMRGTITDASGAVVPNAVMTIKNQATGLTRTTQTDSSGTYDVPALPPGAYDIEIKASGMQTQNVTGVVLLVTQVLNRNFMLGVAKANEVVDVSGEAPTIESGTMTVGTSINERTVQEIPLNGRHFVDLSLLTAGTVTPPANGFLTAPLRGQGSFGVNTAGTREDTVNFMINGINLNDMANGQITFQPSINTVSEFTMDNSTYSAEYGRNSGAVVNIATRSGSNNFHGEVFDFARNEFFDARNFFNKTGTCTLTNRSGCMSSFKRQNFGASVGGPIWKNKTFFFASYEGLRQRQGLTLNTKVLTAAQRAAALASPNVTVQKLTALIPLANDPTGTTFLGSATAPVNIDQWTGDFQHNFNDSNRLHGYYAFQKDLRKEPNLQGNNIPGFGDTRQSHRQIMSINDTQVFSSHVVNEARLGYNRIHIVFAPDSNQDPSAYGINDGLSGPVGLPQMEINSLGLTFGGIRAFPQGRGDYTAVLSDTLNYLRGKHSFKFGGEFRRFNGNSFTSDDGGLAFATVTDFINGNINAAPTTFVQATPFAITSGNRPARVYANGIGLFVQDNFKMTPYFTWELGLRWEWNTSPTEALNRSSNFFPTSDSLVQLGTNGYSDSINQNNHNFEPRVGFSWDVFHNGRTVLRSGYGYLVDQFLPGPVIQSSNPPFATPLAVTGTTTFANLLTAAGASGLAPTAIATNYKNGYIQSWNLNIQQQVTATSSLMIGYFGNKGTHLNLAINENQLLNGVRPLPTLSASSPVDPGRALGNITEYVSTGNSNYNALWITGNKQMGRGLQFTATYTWSKALDYNSRNFQGLVVQNSLNPRGDYGLSDYDTRHRFVFGPVYQLPGGNSRLLGGWQLAGILQLQTGNPLNILSGSPISSAAAGVTGINVAAGSPISGFTGASTIRPDVISTPTVVNQIITTGGNAGAVQWLAPNSVCDPRYGACPAGAQYAIPVALVGGVNSYHFGNMQRNSVTGPGFQDLDVSLTKTTRITERVKNELRLEAFDVLNHPNFGNPNLTAQVGSSSFGVIRSTRFPTGDSGSARQLQLGLKFIF